VNITLMLCVKWLVMGYLDAVCEEAGNEGPELATLMLCVKRLAMRVLSWLP
jgi:hypothetical protein